jgi:hypothetical protein
MQAAGWTKKSMVGGTKLWIDLGDRVLNAYPTFSKTPTELVFHDHAAVWFERWARARFVIFPSMTLDACAIVRRTGQHGWMRTPGEGSAQFIHDATDRLLDWARGIEEAAEISRPAQPRDLLGLSSFEHITALAVSGQVEALERWQQEVGRGDATRLHPLVKLDSLQRAISIAASSRPRP